MCVNGLFSNLAGWEGGGSLDIETVQVTLCLKDYLSVFLVIYLNELYFKIYSDTFF